MRRLATIPLFVILSTVAYGQEIGPAARAAFSASGIKPGDSVDLRIKKALSLIVDRNYLNLSASHDYAPDSQRNAEQVLSERNGGGCGSAAMALAAILRASGIPEENLRLVAAVVNDDYKEICDKSGAPRRPEERVNGRGHVFVMVRSKGDQWLIVNSTSRSDRVESAETSSPDALFSHIDKKPVAVPVGAYRSFLSDPGPSAIFRSGLTVFASWKPSQYPRHTWKDRLDLIASGRKGSSRCRYDADLVLMNRPDRSSSSPVLAPPGAAPRDSFPR